MRNRLVLPVIAIVALLVPSALVAAPTGAPSRAPKAKPSKKKYVIFGSCDNGKPYKASGRCHYDKARLFRGTFVFESHTGKKPLKACFVIYGAKPLGGGHACAKLPPTAYKAYPFKISGVRQKFSVKVSWFVKSKGAYKPVGSSFMKVTP